MTVTFKELGKYGRFGNALFQISATIGYAKKYDVPFVFPTWKESNEINLSNDYFVNPKLINTFSEYSEKSYKYQEIPFRKNCNLLGYFQSWKYFDHCSDFIREALMPPEPEDDGLFRNMCSIHVRRGDYLKFPKHHPFLGMEYYQEAIKNIPCEKFLIFSDDVNWCKNNFIGNQFIVTEAASPYIDFKMQIACEHHIIANSSFSWWAAWLGDGDGRKIIAPKRWFGPKLAATHPLDDLIPKHWELI